MESVNCGKSDVTSERLTSPWYIRYQRMLQKDETGPNATCTKQPKAKWIRRMRIHEAPFNNLIDDSPAIMPITETRYPLFSGCQQSHIEFADPCIPRPLNHNMLRSHLVGPHHALTKPAKRQFIIQFKFGEISHSQDAGFWNELYPTSWHKLTTVHSKLNDLWENNLPLFKDKAAFILQTASCSLWLSRWGSSDGACIMLIHCFAGISAGNSRPHDPCNLLSWVVTRAFRKEIKAFVLI